MKISIITASYNSAATIADTLRSVAEQDYPNIEHIIVDGVSKDNTLEIVAGFPHIAKVVSEPDKGIYDAMNKGIQLATGDIIGILNSDDFYTNNAMITSIVKCFQDKPEIETLYGDLVFVDAQNTDAIKRKWKAGAYHRHNFLYGWMPPHPTFFVRREIYEQNGVFNLCLKSAADYELMLRFLYKNKVSTFYYPKVFVKMRLGGQSTANFKNRFLANREDRKAWEMNDLKPYFYTLYLKPIRKIFQFL